MCGIAGIYIKKPGHEAVPRDPETIDFFVDMLLLGIESRGTDATGMFSASVGGQDIVYDKTSKKASEFIADRQLVVPNPRMVLCHTRFATQGPVENNLNNHPVRYNSTYVIHNGHIRNDDELFEKHEIERQAQVDTEIIPALFDKFGFDKAHLALQELDGGFAVAVADPVNFPDQLILAKGPSSPLVYLETPYVIVWASTRNAIELAWRKTIGNKIPRKKFWNELQYANMMIISPEETETLRFTVYHKPYVSTYSGTLAGNYGWDRKKDDHANDWRSSSKERWSDVCFCGHTQFWHLGAEYDSRCAVSTCECEKMDSVYSECSAIESATVSTLFVDCCACDRRVLRKVCTDYAGYFICSQCDGEGDLDASEFDASPATEATDTTTEEVAAALNAAEAIDEIAELLKEDAKQIEWLLFEADDIDFDKDPSLVNLWIVADDMYAELTGEAQIAYSHRRARVIESVTDAAEDPEACGVQVFDGEVVGEEVDA